MPGFDPEPEATDRLFFAAQPDKKAAGRILQLARYLRSEHGLDGRPFDAWRLHVSLLGLGDYFGVPQDLLASARQAAWTVSLPPFVVGFDRVLSWSKNSNPPFVLTGSNGIAGLVELRRVLGVAMQRFGWPRVSTSSFNPHVTLLYDDQCVPERAIEPVSWEVREFVLIHNRLKQNLPYEVLGRWPLRA